VWHGSYVPHPCCSLGDQLAMFRGRIKGGTSVGERVARPKRQRGEPSPMPATAATPSHA